MSRGLPSAWMVEIEGEARQWLPWQSEYQRSGNGGKGCILFRREESWAWRCLFIDLGGGYLSTDLDYSLCLLYIFVWDSPLYGSGTLQLKS